MTDSSNTPSDGDRGPYRSVYEQYWYHARHVENELWLYTRIWAVILAAIFTIIGSPLPDNSKTAAALFGALLSLLGFAMVYSLRIPFLAFALTSEVLAINEFGLSSDYRRFFRDGTDFRAEKGIDLPDILMLIYGTVAVALVFVAGAILGYAPVAGAGAFIIAIGLLALYLCRVRPKFTNEKKRAYQKIDGRN